MPETAPPPVVAEPTAVGDDVVSPELVLVDPTLRDRLAALPPPGPLVAPRPQPEPPREPPALRAPAEPPPEPAAPPPAAEAPSAAPIEQPRRRRRWPLLLAAVVGAGLSAAATILLLPQSKSSPPTARVADPGRTGHIGTPTSSGPPPPPIATTPPKTTHKSKPATSAKPPARTATHPKTTPAVRTPTTTPARTTPARTKPKPATTPPSPPVSGGSVKHEKLAWAPAAGATAYEMDLLKGSKRVFHKRTRGTSLIITVRSGARGPAGSLPPGDYEWIVWPIVGGHKAQPTVRSRLTLPG